MTSELAIRGGEPVFSNGPAEWPVANQAIKDSLLQALENGSWGKYHADGTERLCDRIAEMFGTEHVLLCCSGTVAVEVALRGLGVRGEDEVILAGYDFPGNFRAIEAIGARPVLVDVVPNGWVINPTKVTAAISEKTKAIIVSHLHGQIADVKSIRAIAHETNPQIKILEDNCQMPGGKIGDQWLGSFGDVGTLSFGGSKLLSSGRGGAIISADQGIYQRANIYNSRGNDAFPLSQLQAFALLPQLEQLESQTQARETAATTVITQTSELSSLTGLNQVVGFNENQKSETLVPGYYKLPWLLSSQSNWLRDDFVKAIQAEGLNIDVGFRGFTRRSPRRCRIAEPLVNSQVAAQQTLLLHHPILLSHAESISKIAYALTKVFDHKA